MVAIVACIVPKVFPIWNTDHKNVKLIERAKDEKITRMI